MFALFSVLNRLLISGTIREKQQTVAAHQVKYLNIRILYTYSHKSDKEAGYAEVSKEQ